ncbi:uncharacterized protein JCM15063_005881 [Sporobolomyces koalae]|uniref:uncharacterized protein n=1 Tax=Sporobolomyces koalae TaxID=500713 RepID=UPI00317E2E5F
MSIEPQMSPSGRGSAASSITIQVSTTTCSSLPSCDIEESIAPLDEISTTIEPFPVTSTPSRPSSPPTLPPARCLTTTTSLDEATACPPPYQFPPSPGSQTLNPLSFYPFSTLTPLGTPESPNLQALERSLTSTTSVGAPPAYDQVPETLAEKCFVYGFLCPLIWIYGMTKYWRSERPVGFQDRAKIDLEQGTIEGGYVEESLACWREEEKVWALRCAWSLGAFSSILIVMGILLASILGKL